MDTYPPGTGPGDPRAPWNDHRPDTSHEHEFELTDGDPHLVDGKAVFAQECVHETVLDTARGYKGERVVTNAISCDETRRVSAPPIRVTKIDEWEQTVDKPAGERAPPVAEAIRRVEQAGDDVSFVNVDPPRSSRSARVVAEAAGYRIVYEAHDA